MKMRRPVWGVCFGAKSSLSRMSSKSEVFLVGVCVAVVVSVVGCVEGAVEGVFVWVLEAEEEELKRIEVRVLRGSIWVRCWRNGVGLARRLRARRRTSILDECGCVRLCRFN